MAGGSSGQGGWAVAGLGPGSLVAGYRVEARIGAGGMAMVLRARDEALGRTVALKILAPALADDEEFRERFIRESRAAARVDHPHIIPVHAAGETDGVLYLAMRFVPGGDLRSLIQREGTLTGERAAFLLSPIASALDAAHAAGLVHRDVKPANVLIDTSPGRPDHPYLSDFGLAKGTASTTGLTETGQFLGTPDYAAPEQISGKPVGPQTDQYALACVAYTMFTGSLPFARSASMAVLWAHMYDPPPSVSTRRRDLPLALDGVLDRALAKVPAERFGSCGEFTDALRAALGLPPYAGSRSGASTASTTAGESSPLVKPAGSNAPPPTPTETVTPHPSFPPRTGTAPPQWHLPSMPSPLTVTPSGGSRSPESPPASSGAAHRDLAASHARADRDKRRRRLLVRCVLAGGVAVAAAAIAILVSFIGNSPSAPGTTQVPPRPAGHTSAGGALASIEPVITEVSLRGTEREYADRLSVRAVLQPAPRPLAGHGLVPQHVQQRGVPLDRRRVRGRRPGQRRDGHLVRRGVLRAAASAVRLRRYVGPADHRGEPGHDLRERLLRRPGPLHHSGTGHAGAGSTGTPPGKSPTT